jgi:sugar phosphate permease
MAVAGWHASVYETSPLNVAAHGSTPLLVLFITLWAVVRFFQSAAWGSIMKIVPRWFGESTFGRVLGLCNLTYGLGDAAVRLMLGMLASSDRLQWWDVWYLACGMAVLFGLPTVWWVKGSPRLIGEPEPNDRKSVHKSRPHTTPGNPVVSTSSADQLGSAKSSATRPSVWRRMRPIVTTARFWLVIFYYVGLTFVRETFLSWTAQFLSESMQLSASQAGVWSLIVPLFAAVSAMLGGYLIDRVPFARKPLVSMGFLVLNVGALLGLSAVIARGLNQSSVALCLVLLALEAFGMEAPYTFIDGIYAIELGGKASAATVVGVIQAAGNLGGIAAGWLVGAVTQDHGWDVMFAGMAGIVGIVLATQVVDFLMPKRRQR